MSGRFVRASKYRHVHGVAPRKEKAYANIRPMCSGDGNYITGNRKFIMLSVQGGGGPVLIHDRSKVGRLEHNAPRLNVHKNRVLNFAFSPFMDTLVGTVSEDCYFKITVIPDGGLTEDILQASATLEGHQKKVSQISFHPTANNVVATGSYDDTIKVWDIEAQSENTSFSSPNIAYSMGWNRDGSLLAGTFKDHNLRVFDPRAPDAAQTTKSFEGGKNANVVWLPNLNKIAAVGFSKNSMRQYAVWDPKKMDAPLVTKDIDQSAGVLMPFFDPDTSVLYIGGKGDGNIRYFEVVDEEPYVHYLSEFRSSEAQKGLGFLPKTACDVKKCEVAVGLRLMRDWVCPVSFEVPRKSDLFQADIFPDTYAGESVITAADYFAGKNAEPKMVSMKPGAAKSSGGGTFKAKKSPAELQRELDAANARIKELEAEVAKLKA